MKLDHRFESYCHPHRVYPDPDPCQHCLTVMALRGRAGYLSAQMAPLVADTVVQVASWMQKVGYLEARHHDLELTQWDDGPCPEEVKVRC